jgi:outer membrane protein OmpA-like peptidoglycan-associated protein
MSDEKPPLENHSRAEPAAGDTNVSVSSTKTTLPPAVALAFVIIALLGVLIVMVLRGNKGGSASGAPELTQLQAEANALRTQLNNERVAMGLRPLEGGSESVEEIAGRLKKDADTMVALAASFQAMLADKDIEIKAKNAEILRLEQLRESFAAESKRLNDELQRALVSGSGADLLRRDLDGMKAQRDALATELASVRDELAAKGKGVSADDFADLQRRYDETLRAKEFFEAKVKELEGDLSKAKLFASSENELLPAAVELFRSLRLLENKPDSEISTAYSSLGASLGANVLHTLNFATGSSVLTPADDELIRNIVADIPDGDLVLAIGYASETGNVDSNRVLSSDRATAAATLFSSVKRPTQLVQAVYLGQTDRFSSRIPERNQIVEIWRIRKK